MKLRMIRVVLHLVVLVPALSSLYSCGGPPRDPDAADGMTQEEFLAATAADLERAGAEMDERTAANTAHVGLDDTYRLPNSLTREEFFQATQDDLARAGDEILERSQWTPHPVRTAQGLIQYMYVPTTAATDVQITLHDSWVTKNRNRATVSVTFDAEGMSKVHRIDRGGDDGDVHIGGTSAGIGLPLVVEIMNAKGHASTSQAIADIEDDNIVEVAGAWRLWCEHPGVPQIQFGDTPYDGPPSNPDHVFEIHPASMWGSYNCLDTFRPIAGGTKQYSAYEAQKAFRYYESVPCRLEHDDTSQTTTIWTPQARYNYAEFWITPDEEQGLPTGDGYILRCSVLAEDGTIVTDNRRMIFIKGSDVCTAARNLKLGDKLHVLGLPRMNLSVIRWRVLNAAQRPEVLTWNLPYEMICVAIL